MKKMLFLVAAVLVLQLVPSFSTDRPAKADANTTIFYSQTRSISAELSISGTTATCSGELVPRSGSTAVSINVTLYQYNTSKKKWVSVKSWDGKSSAKGTHTVKRGFRYKTISIGTVKNASGTTETATKESKEKTC